MRALFILALIVLAGVAAGYSLLESGSGYVLVAIAGYTIEMPFFIALFINIGFFFVLFFLFSIVRMLLHTRRNMVGWATNQRRQRGLNRTTQGLVAFVEGRWDFARKSLDKAAENSSTPLVNYLFAARASSAIGDAKAVDGFLKQAELSTEGADVAIGLTQAELQLQNKQYEQALATLLRVKKQVSNHPVVLNLLVKVYTELSDWQSLLKLLPALRHGAKSEKDVANLEQYACNELLVLAGKHGSEGALTDCWKQLPSSARKRSVIVACYAEQLIALGELELAESVLRTQLHRHYDTQLIEVYGRTVGEKPEKQLAYAEKLAKSNPDEVEVFIALARIARRMNLPEQAGKYYENSLAINASPSAYAELAALYASQGDYKKSAELYSEGAKLKSGSSRQLVTAQ